MEKLDISQVIFDDEWLDEESGLITQYFTVPVDWLENWIENAAEIYPEAISAEIAIEYPVLFQDAANVIARVSPTKYIDESNPDLGTTDYDWTDIWLFPEEIVALIDLAEKGYTYE